LKKWWLKRNGSEKNNIIGEQTIQRFSSNPANCNDMGKLGYTLNGFYFVNGSDNLERFGVFSVNLNYHQHKSIKVRVDM